MKARAAPITVARKFIGPQLRGGRADRTLGPAPAAARMKTAPGCEAGFDHYVTQPVRFPELQRVPGSTILSGGTVKVASTGCLAKQGPGSALVTACEARG